MEKLGLAIKGAILGIANIIPGVSGGTLAITMGIYEELIEVISHFFKNIKKNLKFIIPIGIGAVLSVLLMSKVINISLDKFPFATTFFFIGLILGGLPLISKNVKGKKLNPTNIIVFILTFSLIMFMTFFKGSGANISLKTVSLPMMMLLFLVGVVAAATMVIPGVSGSFVLMLLGFYKPIINTISNLTKLSNLGHNFLILCPFGLGVLVGFILVAKLIEFLLSKCRTTTYYGILGFITSSIIALFITAFKAKFGVLEVIVGIILLIAGGLVGYKLGGK